MSQNSAHVIVIFGASGDLSKKYLYPALWNLFKCGKLPDKLRICGYARSAIDVGDIFKRTKEFMDDTENPKFTAFWEINHYVKGSYTNVADAEPLTNFLKEIDAKFDEVDHTFYLALPSSVYESASELIASLWIAKKGRTKVALEKPFGRDLESCLRLDKHLLSLFERNQLCLIDHYLCLEMVRSILPLRFGQNVFAQTWNNQFIESVLITFKEDFGTEGRGGYFDSSGIIRDVMQNHLLQILSLLAMDRPEKTSVSDAKAELVASIRKVKMEDVVLGQYIGSGKTGQESHGYLDDPTVPKDSKTPTFATIVFFIDKANWKGVPFIIRCGKATNEVKDEVRIQYKPSRPASRISSTSNRDRSMSKHELVIQIKPTPKLTYRMASITPNEVPNMVEMVLDKNAILDGPYERLLLSIIDNKQEAHFVGREELINSWKLFTPILQQIEEDSHQPFPYEYGSLGPKEAEELCSRHNFNFPEEFPW